MYEKAIVSFIDILGFKNLVENSSPEVIKSILDISHRFTKPKKRDEVTGYEIEAEFISFSDCIVRIRKIERGLNAYHPLGLVYYELEDILKAQGELVAQGVLMRGGIAYGDIYFQENMIYGPALNQAYELEAQYAVYPRVVVSPDLIVETKINRLLKDEDRSHEEELEYIEELLKEGDEGFWFINYLRGMRNVIDTTTKFLDYLLNHKKLICDGVQNSRKKINNLAKYLWLARYHNDFIQSISGQYWFSSTGIKVADLEIQTEEFPMLQKLKI